MMAEYQHYYIFVPPHVYPSDFNGWTKWMMETEESRIINQEHYRGYWISTVFLGINHSFCDGAPHIFETMIFDPDKEGVERGKDFGCWRCATLVQAHMQHDYAKKEIDSVFTPMCPGIIEKRP